MGRVRGGIRIQKIRSSVAGGRREARLVRWDFAPPKGRNSGVDTPVCRISHGGVSKGWSRVGSQAPTRPADSTNPRASAHSARLAHPFRSLVRGGGAQSQTCCPLQHRLAMAAPRADDDYDYLFKGVLP